MRLLIYCFLYFGFRYRKKIVFENLKECFPNQPNKGIAKKYYWHLAKLIVDTIKFGWIPIKEIVAKIKIVNPEIIDELLRDGKGFILMMGHYGNWEYAGASLSIYTQKRMAAVYKPLKNKFFDKILVNSRKRFGSDLFPIHDFRKFLEYKKKGMGIIVIADQSPTSKHQFTWINFLNRPTAFHSGPEKFAQKLDMPVIYGDLQEINDNQHELKLEWIEKNPSQSQDGEITKIFASKLESNILRNPHVWVWSHKRWKLKP